MKYEFRYLVTATQYTSYDGRASNDPPSTYVHKSEPVLQFREVTIGNDPLSDWIYVPTAVVEVIED